MGSLGSSLEFSLSANLLSSQKAAPVAGGAMGERSSRSISRKVDFSAQKMTYFKAIIDFSSFPLFIRLLSDHGVKTIGSNTKVLRTFASDFDDQAR